jgi:hypothetical protein
MSPHQVLWDAISGSCVVGDAAFDHRALIALANASCSFRWYELIASASANDRNFATTEPLTQRVIGGDVTYLIAIGKIVSLISLSSRQAVLFDQLLDLRMARFLVRLFLCSEAQLLIARGFGELSLLRSEFRAGRQSLGYENSTVTLPLMKCLPGNRRNDGDGFDASDTGAPVASILVQGFPRGIMPYL